MKILDDVAEGSQDYIFSLNVLEHIKDDDAVLQLLFRSLRPGGVIYLYLPAFPILYSSMDRKVGHHRRYKKSQLTAKLRKAGFQVIQTQYEDSLGFAATLLYQWLGSRRGHLNLKSLRFYDRWLFPLSRLLDRLCGRFFGKNVAVVATRPARSNRVSRPAFERRARYPAAH